MSKLSITKKILTFLTCSALSAGIVAYAPKSDSRNFDASAKTIAEIQEQRKANDEKIAALEGEISALEGSKENEKAYQATLNEQIGLIQENINLLNTELERIGEEINVTENNIAELDKDIENQQIEIDENIELFKQRLCAMYVNGNETSASVILGSDSFYDMMSRFQMLNSIAEYDEKLINDILDEIDRLDKSKKDMETEKLNLEMKLDDQERRKEEKDAEIADLNVKMQKTQDEINRLALEQQMLSQDKAELEQANADLEAEQAAIEEAIRKAAEEAQRRYEEEQRRLAAERAAAEEAARQAAAEEAARQAAAAAAAENNNSSSTYVEPTTAAPAYTAPTPTVIPSVSTYGFAWPAPGFCYISSYYGYRWGTTHGGIDIGDAGISGGAAVASQSGTVVTVNNSCTHNYAKTSSCGCGGGYGNYVIISHDGTYSTVYGHLASACVSVGDYVQQGQVIGYIGSTGWSTGAHLHFEVRVNGVRNDPMNYVSP